jgi:phage terminase large subunit GpA-like protein
VNQVQSIDRLIASWARAAMPPSDLRVSEWADQVRILPTTSASRGGRWHTTTTPYLREIMDAVHEVGVRTIALRKCAQSGGTEAIANIIGYFIEHDPCPILMVHPTAAAAEAWSKERLADMIRTTPALRAVVRDKRQPRGSHESESTLGLKMFPGGFLALGGANTPNTFARWAVRLAIADDADRFPPVVGEEGDPADLLVNRTLTFPDALTIFVSTPVLKGGRIDTFYERSDQRRYFVTCPRCGRSDWVAWNDPTHIRVAFDERDARTARLECPDEAHGGCGARMDETSRRAMIAEDEWRATATPQQSGLVGFHLPAMLSTLGTVSLYSLVGDWLLARTRGKEALKAFITTRLAEGWEDRGARMEPHVLMARRESYGKDVEVPGAAVVLTAGVDVQVDRLELLVMGWGPAAERWVVDRRSVPGDPKRSETWAALLEALGRRYAHACGLELPILGTCVDSGYATEQVYDFVLAHQARRIWATKGFSGRSGEPIVGKPSEKRYGRSPRPVRLYPINVDDAKADVMTSLSLVEAGPGYMHFPADLETITEEFFAQLCAEHRETRYNKGGIATHSVWVADRDRNEALDCAVLCLAAHRLLNPNIRQVGELLAQAAAAKRSGQPTPPTSGAHGQPVAPGRQVTRSRYLQG